MSQPPSESSETTPDLFRPSTGRGLLAAIFAVVSFFIPQEIPLEWYPLNNPSSGLQYLEITCAANVNSSVEIFLDAGRGFNELDKISWPIGPSEMAFTYTFPLADTPLYRLRLDPLSNGTGELTITNFRIINRRGEEIRRFDRETVTDLFQIADIAPLAKGWKIVVANSTDPSLQIPLDRPLVAEGMNERNLKRCLLSTGYLAMMLWILLLAVFFTFRRPEPWRQTLSSMGFLAFLGVLFAFVGNRGLIRNSVRYAQFSPPPPSKTLFLELDVNAPATGGQLFWDIGQGINGKDSQHIAYNSTPNLQTVRFALPRTPIKLLRFDPLDISGKLIVRSARVMDGNGNIRASIPADGFLPMHQIAHIETSDRGVVIETTPDANDPMLQVKPESLAKINQLLQDAPR